MKSHHAYQLAAMKAALINHVLTGKISVTGAARSVKKSRVTIYDWMTRYKTAGLDGLLPKKTGLRGSKAWNRSAPETEAVVLEMLEQHHDWNIYDIAARLPQEHRVHPCTVYRIWKRHRQGAAATRLPRPAPQRYVKERVGEEIQMDTSFPWGRAAKRVCFDCLDDRSRFAVARLYEHCDQDSSIAFLQHVIAHAPFIIRAIRTDCGREWSTRFSVACALAGIQHIRNEPYHPEHNGKIEKFHDGLKYRCFYVYLHPSDCMEQQNSDLQQWLVWYNYHKIHLGMGMDRKTPAEVVFQSLLSESSCVRLMLQPNIFRHWMFNVAWRSHIDGAARQ
ncbi:MAG: Integrase catalytic subunit [Candidatus Peregrinibacteria bacterium Greene1014_49]|nr:MAG: Integrase catalytic subunit [Candidatus Peregrinibacteria bacterium Greene1014_49]